MCYVGLFAGSRKVRSQVIGEDRSQIPGRGAVKEVRRGGRACDRTKERVHRLGLGLGEKEE